jgi:hypothetical protein
MPYDPLAPYRRTPLTSRATDTPAGGIEPPPEPEEYEAFGTKDKVGRLTIHNWHDPSHSPGYQFLLDISYDSREGTNFALVYTTMIVGVRGKNLQRMVFAIQNHMADFIQVFDQNRWKMPQDAKAPLIESIEFIALQGGAPATENHH